MKYIEIGIGNTWFVRTETENKDGTEFEERGIIKPIYFESLYVRVWFRKTCLIFDTKEGFKKVKKRRIEYKFIFGIVSRLDKEKWANVRSYIGQEILFDLYQIHEKHFY